MTLSEQDNGRTVDLPAGAIVTVRLKENPTTGYRWAVESAGGLSLIADNTAASGAAPGAAGVHEFQFRATSNGTFELRLKNSREWETDSSGIDRFNVTISAR